jgi:hypothetical protein
MKNCGIKYSSGLIIVMATYRMGMYQRPSESFISLSIQIPASSPPRSPQREWSCVRLQASLYKCAWR